eukprot:15372972-Alexandrium_andersonii.AAC.1
MSASLVGSEMCIRDSPLERKRRAKLPKGRYCAVQSALSETLGHALRLSGGTASAWGRSGVGRGTWGYRRARGTRIPGGASEGQVFQAPLLEASVKGGR